MWEGKPGDSSRSQLAPGAYHVQVQDRCNTKDDTTLRILPGPDPTAALHLAQQPPLRPGRPLRLSNESVRADSFSWQIGQQTLADTRVPAGTSFQRSGEQPLQLRAYANGCADTATRTISVSGIAVALPSAFSPDGDGRNDRWQPYGPSAHLAGRLRVYSRWGELVHESSGQRPGWNGRCGGAPCPPGVYTYELQLRAGAEQITRRGTITLLR
jgi:gliding motility-associated-like protein